MEAVGLATVLLNLLKYWFYWRWRVRVTSEESPNPPTWEYGYAQNSVKVEVAVRGSRTIEIRDVRLMLARKWGFPPKAEPPVPPNPQLPARLLPDTAETWHFPAETIAGVLKAWSPSSSPRRTTATLRPRVTTAAGSVHRGRRIRFSLDINAHSR
ncbi:hypothetical protein [Candidatus Poriferisodalis sp.]|uniref:hypothetical protein n=1 Tax=Candidatus Poriferisodalis sp. TaxID=3101277 RepID=UPI003B02B5F0